MQKRFLWFLPVVLAAGLVVAGTTPLTPDERAAAQKLYQSKCARCHRFHDPSDYTDKEWLVWMDKMSRKARLKPDQKELLSRYLDTFRTSPDLQHTNAAAK